MSTSFVKNDSGQMTFINANLPSPCAKFDGSKSIDLVCLHCREATVEHPIILVDCMNDNKEARSISADRRPIQVSIHNGDSPKVSNRNGDSPNVSNRNGYSPETSIPYRHNPDNKVIMIGTNKQPHPAETIKMASSSIGDISISFPRIEDKLHRHGNIHALDDMNMSQQQEIDCSSPSNTITKSTINEAHQQSLCLQDSKSNQFCIDK